MSLHPKLRSMIDLAADRPPMDELSIESIRSGDMTRFALVPKVEVGSVGDRVIKGKRGPLRVRIYHPPAGENWPVIVFFHGGGFVTCSIDTHDALCRQMCIRSQMIVVSVDYALAPEQKFPAAPDDCEAATLWVSENAESFGGDPRRMAVAGDSAGGALAAVTALRCRNIGLAHLKAQFLIYPVTDHPSAGMSSYLDRGVGFGLTAATMHWFWSQYLAKTDDATHPHASPNRAIDLSGLPPTYLVTAEYDPLRDEGTAFAANLREAGTATTHVHLSHANHGFMSWVGLIDMADNALQSGCDWLRATI